MGISECLVDDRRRVVSRGFGKVDDSGVISETLMTEIPPKAIPLDGFYPLDDDVNFSTLGYGQSSLIRKGGISRSHGETTFHCTVVPVTAKHNLRIVKESNSIFVPKRATLNMEAGVTDFVSQDLGWEPPAADEINIREECEGSRPAFTLWGLGISIGLEISKHMIPLTDPAYAFDLVRPKFKLKVGQKVAIAVNFRPKAKPTKESIKGSGPKIPGRDVSEQALEDIYGKPDCVNVYTGTITFVGVKDIEYSCNAFSGCSGAVVFLLDKDQPDSVQACD
eukprot:scaffold46056_cov48-Attheya_sp.AAC.1